MITEKHFALSHSAFWHQLLPLSESYVRECNLEAARFCDELESKVKSSMRGLVNETGFRLFRQAWTSNCSPHELSAMCVLSSVSAASRHISGLRQFHRAPLENLDDAGTTEAKEIADRLLLFFSKASTAPLVVFPAFPGCGWLDQSCGDVLSGAVLFEVKGGARSFRSADIRQLLCYCALNFASKSYDIVEVCLVNPRSGRYVTEAVEAICRRLAGRPAAAVLSDIVAYVSDPPDRYATS